MTPFPCTGCGMCCRKVGQAVTNAKKMIEDGLVNDYVQEVAGFPFEFNDQGVCVKLQDDHSCGDYENRPDICKVSVTWQKHHSAYMPWNAFVASSIEVCNELMKEGGSEENFFITTETLEQ